MTNMEAINRKIALLEKAAGKCLQREKKEMADIWIKHADEMIARRGKMTLEQAGMVNAGQVLTGK
jgi:hypothetical protein